MLGISINIQAQDRRWYPLLFFFLPKSLTYPWFSLALFTHTRSPPYWHIRPEPDPEHLYKPTLASITNPHLDARSPSSVGASCSRQVRGSFPSGDRLMRHIRLSGTSLLVSRGEETRMCQIRMVYGYGYGQQIAVCPHSLPSLPYCPVPNECLHRPAPRRPSL